MTAFVPHTLTEQIALITAEAEGRVIIAKDGSGDIRHRHHGEWFFGAWRYEVEQPLMEEWKVYDRFGVCQAKSTTCYHANELMSGLLSTHKSCAPFRVVHMREVRATQGPTP